MAGAKVARPAALTGIVATEAWTGSAATASAEPSKTAPFLYPGWQQAQAESEAEQ